LAGLFVVGEGSEGSPHDDAVAKDGGDHDRKFLERSVHGKDEGIALKAVAALGIAWHSYALALVAEFVEMHRRAITLRFNLETLVHRGLVNRVGEHMLKASIR